MTRVPVVGGPLHGQLREPHGAGVGGVVVVPVVGGRERYTVRRMMATLPGRTDRQVFSVLDYGTWPQSRWRVGAIGDAVTRAWALGWAPGDETSEFWPDGPAPRSD